MVRLEYSLGYGWMYIGLDWVGLGWKRQSTNYIPSRDVICDSRGLEMEEHGNEAENGELDTLCLVRKLQ